ncbi:arylsulfatase [Ramlibacter sp. AW1]|uniref:Arylsulfatase n=1 Tax=Ramlibacter aurantiacus TaxID=2801330 RepID=A0A936ZQM9_9BURK|nr:arylsulfatase [Ramlibacter aurantiacus]MBL0419235.1 arylsulfatase [Ramlibacter aurantiacus]
MSGTDPSFDGVIGDTWRESRPSWLPPRQRSASPNVVFIVLDDVGYADLGCYGSEIRTPHIDAMAARGLQYNNFHVTSMCSPTRACLLTGRNAHAVGMGFLADFDSGYPGYRGHVSTHAATLAEMLRDHGFSTLAAGKWHLTPAAEISHGGPFRHWPTERGFDRWFGFQGALADQWHPDLYEDKCPLPPAAGGGKHLSEQLVDRASRYLVDHRVAHTGSPFFLYLAFGAAHWPHQVPAGAIEHYRGRYDRGWDVLRRQRFERQLELGIVPPGTRLPPSNPGVPAWDSLTADERTVCARFMETYAAFVEHTDEQIGRLRAQLERLDLAQDTLVVLLSDNGASPEGGRIGTVNTRKHFFYEPEPVAEPLALADRMGGEDSFSHYPVGWAQASNTPLKWYKTHTHGGGVRAPLVVDWPAGIRRPGLRTQFHHVTDIVPTVLEIAGLGAPAVYRGTPQLPIQGTSLRYTFDEPQAPTRKPSQYFELLGNRGIWQDGWKALTHHVAGTRFEDDVWELYHLDRDFSECVDLAREQPERLAALRQLFEREARAHSVLPLDDRLFERIAARMQSAPTEYLYYPGMSRTDRLRSPNLTGRSHRFTADVELDGPRTQGVLLCAGTAFCGYTWFVRDGRLVHEYVFSPGVHEHIEAVLPPKPARVRLAYEFRKTGPTSGETTLSIDGQVLATGRISRTWPSRALNTGMLCGRDAGTRKSPDYEPPFAFTGVLHEVRVHLGDDLEGDPYAHYRSYRTGDED